MHIMGKNLLKNGREHSSNIHTPDKVAVCVGALFQPAPSTPRRMSKATGMIATSHRSFRLIFEFSFLC